MNIVGVFAKTCAFKSVTQLLLPDQLPVSSMPFISNNIIEFIISKTNKFEFGGFHVKPSNLLYLDDHFLKIKLGTSTKTTQ